jgi:hypothetical protein
VLSNIAAELTKHIGNSGSPVFRIVEKQKGKGPEDLVIIATHTCVLGEGMNSAVPIGGADHRRISFKTYEKFFDTFDTLPKGDANRAWIYSHPLRKFDFKLDEQTPLRRKKKAERERKRRASTPLSHRS